MTLLSVAINLAKFGYSQKAFCVFFGIFLRIICEYRLEYSSEVPHIVVLAKKWSCNQVFFAVNSKSIMLIWRNRLIIDDI
jgi:hypothetical protein